MEMATELKSTMDRRSRFLLRIAANTNKAANHLKSPASSTDLGIIKIRLELELSAATACISLKDNVYYLSHPARGLHNIQLVVSRERRMDFEHHPVLT